MRERSAGLSSTESESFFQSQRLSTRGNVFISSFCTLVRFVWRTSGKNKNVFTGFVALFMSKRPQWITTHLDGCADSRLLRDYAKWVIARGRKVPRSVDNWVGCTGPLYDVDRIMLPSCFNAFINRGWLTDEYQTIRRSRTVTEAVRTSRFITSGQLCSARQDSMPTIFSLWSVACRLNSATTIPINYPRSSVNWLELLKCVSRDSLTIPQWCEIIAPLVSGSCSFADDTRNKKVKNKKISRGDLLPPPLPPIPVHLILGRLEEIFTQPGSLTSYNKIPITFYIEVICDILQSIVV